MELEPSPALTHAVTLPLSHPVGRATGWTSAVEQYQDQCDQTFLLRTGSFALGYCDVSVSFTPPAAPI